MDFDYSGYYSEEKQRTQQRYYGSLYGKIADKLRMAGLGILDFGGGDGSLMTFLGNNHAVIADISDSGLALAKKAGFKTVKFDARSEAVGGKYDAVFCMEVLEHLPKPEEVIHKVRGSLKDGGIAVFAVPVEFFRPDGVHHVQQYTPARLRADVEKEGFAFEWKYLKPRFSHSDYGIDAKRVVGAKGWLRMIANSALSIVPLFVKEAACAAMPGLFCGFCVMAFRKK